jgi:hypothetical protein
MLAIYKILLDPSSPRQATRSFWSEEEAGLYERERMTPEQRAAAGDTEPLALKRRGRPPGSKDARPRKLRRHSPTSLPVLHVLHTPYPHDGTCVTCLTFSPTAPSRAGAQSMTRRGPSRTQPTAPPSLRISNWASLPSQPRPRRLSTPSTSSPIRASCADRPTTTPPRRPPTGIHQLPTATTPPPPRRPRTGSHHHQRQTATRAPERRAVTIPSSRPTRPAMIPASRSAGTVGFCGATAATTGAGWG